MRKKSSATRRMVLLLISLTGAFGLMAQELAKPKPKANSTNQIRPLGEDLYSVESGFRGLLVLKGVGENKEALFIDPVCDLQTLKTLWLRDTVIPFPKISQVLLTRHDRHNSQFALGWKENGARVLAAKPTGEILQPAAVAKYWDDIVPLRTSRILHFMPAQGVDTDTAPTSFDWGGFKLDLQPLPCPAPDQHGVLIKDTKTEKTTLFCAQLTTGEGKIFAPYTTDWDHWTDLGLKTHSQSIDKAIALAPDYLIPAFGPLPTIAPTALLKDLKTRVNEAGFLKSFERFSKVRLGNQPNYAFLSREQAESGGAKPWSRLSENLWNTGNTFVLRSKSGGFLVVDPWDPNSAKQIPILQETLQLGTLEVILCSHAHYDHFDGIYSILNRPGQNQKPKIITTTQIAEPLEHPFRFWAPFLDKRPITIDQSITDGGSFTWREYTFRLHDFPGQSRYTMAAEVTIDGKRCLFTADNFFHQDQFSGSGGWMGMNRSTPLGYAQSARKVLDIAPDWVLAEHGGAFVFNREDFERREKWGLAAAKAADALCLSGDHLVDWNPHRIRSEPILIQQTDPVTSPVRWIATNPGQKPVRLDCSFSKGLIFTSQGPQKPGETLVLDSIEPLAIPKRAKGVDIPLIWENGFPSQGDTFRVWR